MSFCLYVHEDEEIKLKYSERKVPFFSSIRNDENVQIFLGEFHSCEEYFREKNWERDSQFLMIEDSFALIKVDKNTKTVYFATSKYGLETLYYCYTDTYFIISDDFWEIANLLAPDFESIDSESVAESLNGCWPLFDGTFLKDVKIVLPAMRGEFSVSGHSLKLEKYYDFKYSPNSKYRLNDATTKMDEILDSAMKRIKKECGDVKYGVGLSGGLDSRLIPFYAKQNNMKIESFIIGDRRPHLFLLSGDHRNARKLAKAYGLKHHECKWDREVFKKSIYIDIKTDPFVSPQFFKSQYDFNCDVLLNGGNGYIIGGSTLPKNIEKLSDNELAGYLRSLGREFKPNSLRNAHLSKAIEVLFGKKVVLHHSEKWFDILLPEGTENRIMSKYKAYIHDEKIKGKSNADIYEGFNHNILGARNKFGGFESLLGTHRSFSIYCPHMFDEALHWPVELLIDRMVLKNLIRNKIPAVSNVKEQKYKGNTIQKKLGIFGRLWGIVEFMIRGNGTDMVNSKFHDIEDIFLSSMNHKTKWFYTLFPSRGVFAKDC